MKKNQQSIDGFTPRRRTKPEGIQKSTSVSEKPTAYVSRRQKKSIDDSKNKTDNSKKSLKNSPESIEEALSNIEIQTDKPSSEKKSRLKSKFEKINKKRLRKGKKPFSWRGFLMRRFAKVFILLAILLGGIYFGERIFSSINNIIKIAGSGNIFDLTQKTKLKQDELGRTNVLIFGTSPEGWDGQDLADSIIVASLNQETKKAYTVSLPRDLWVKHSCANWLGTIAGKLNESYGCGKFSEGVFNERAATEDQKKQAEKSGQDEIAKAASEITGLDIHYKVHANWQVLVQAIDAVGGIDVKVEVWDGSPEMYDVATKVRYKNGEIAHMDGEKALAFSRARGSHGGYGLSGGNFDRERNQQKVIQATVEKINSSKFDLNALTGVISALGNNIKTTFEVKEYQTLLDISQGLKAQNVKSLPLLDPSNNINLLTTGSIGSVSAVLPSAGTFEYSDIQAYISKNTKSSDTISEDAKIVILNGTSITGYAAENQRKLAKDGFNVIEIGSADNLNYKKSKIYQINEKPATIKKLSEKYDASAEKLPQSLSKYKDTADIVIVLGSN